MEVTAKVKESYTIDDLLARGRHLILESAKYGVTTMRAHVEVDNIARLKCLGAGIHLKKELKHLCDVELASNKYYNYPLAFMTSTDIHY
jgi:cytosine/adenosine deaminase-related metal-dependent hydrolase